MSTSASLTSTEPATETPTSSQGPSNNNAAPQSSSLYLFTFLATLLLLLAVSCAIVIRSFILRRRFRRRIEEALAAGVIIPGGLEDGPGGMGRGRRRDFGEKPKLWEVWVDEHGQVHKDSHVGGSEGDNFGKGEGKWEEIQPVSATIVSNSGKTSGHAGGGSTASFPTSEGGHRAFISRLLGRRAFNGASAASTQSVSEERNTSAMELSSETGMAKEQAKEDEKVQVSVLISMPNPNARKGYEGEIGTEGAKGKGKGPGDDGESDEGDIPDVVFGVAEMQATGPGYLASWRVQLIYELYMNGQNEVFTMLRVVNVAWAWAGSESLSRGVERPGWAQG
ncbi:hypothetical protein JB92DRAFT_3099808 [Gautieria morchelliformis]|nr:hypothetical protein JB92DRAFT_3099808 [Gautieria morchelliformis]